MKRKNITLLLCLLMTLFVVKADPDPNFHIYLCWGQSNMEGNATVPDEEKQNVSDRFQMLYTANNCSNGDRKKGEWYTAIPPLARCFHWNNSGFGPIDYFGRTMVEKLDSDIKVGVVVVACGGASIELFQKNKYQGYLSTCESWLREYANQYGGNPYGRLIEMAKEAQKVGVIKGILVHQGETNTNDPNWPNDLKGVHEDMLKDLGLNSADVPLLVGEVRYTGPCSSHNNQVRRVPSVIQNSYVISADGCEAAGDQYHFSVNGYKLLGKRYAEQMLKLLPASDQDGQSNQSNNENQNNNQNQNNNENQNNQNQSNQSVAEELLTGVTTGRYVDIYVNSRQVAVYAPKNAHTNRPLLISCHGMNQDISYQREQTRWEQVADTADFIVAYPQSEGTTWDINGTKDTDFLIAIIKEMSKTYKIDLTRVYLSGFSMGGMLTYHCMNSIPDYFAAFAPISGYMSAQFNASTRPVPLIHTHGTGDDVVHYNADGTWVGAEAMVDGWQKHNHCTQKSTDKVDNCATRTTYSGGDCDADVVLITVPNRGHIPANDNCCHTSKAIWNFVRNYSTGCGKYQASGLAVSVDILQSSDPGEVQISTALVGDINLHDIKIYGDNELLTTGDFYTWSGLSHGSHSVYAVGYDSDNKEQKSAVKNFTIFEPQTPFNGTPAKIPGKVEAEEFDFGGEGNAYHDMDEQNRNGNTRNEGVDMNSKAIGYSQTGEWIEYTVEVETSGTYEVEAYAASGANGSQFTLYLDDKFLIPGSQGTPGGFIDVPNTGSWEDFVTIKSPLNKMTKGTHILKVEITGDWVDLDYLNFKLVEADETDVENIASDKFVLNGEYVVYDVTGKRVKVAKFVNGRTDELKAGFYIVKDEEGNAYPIISGR